MRTREHGRCHVALPTSSAPDGYAFAAHIAAQGETAVRPVFDGQAMKPQPYGPFDYVPIHRRPKLEWPGNAPLALWVIPNIETFALDEKMPSGPGGSGGHIPDVNTWSYRDYGARVGIFRIMQVLARHGVRATTALNSDTCDVYPAIVEEAMTLGWEFMGHNQSNTRRLNDVDDEAAVIKASLDRIEKATGRRPQGWLSAGMQETWSSLDHLAAENIRYVADWVNDDQPYMMNVGNTPLVSMPYSVETNDRRAYDFHHCTPPEFEALIRRQFDVLYREGETSGRVLALAVHPFLTGAPHRIGALDAALEYICSHDGVWKATGSEILEHFLKQKGISS
jgi:allantoinase